MQCLCVHNICVCVRECTLMALSSLLPHWNCHIADCMKTHTVTLCDTGPTSWWAYFCVGWLTSRHKEYGLSWQRTRNRPVTKQMFLSLDQSTGDCNCDKITSNCYKFKPDKTKNHLWRQTCQVLIFWSWPDISLVGHIIMDMIWHCSTHSKEAWRQCLR